MKIIIFFGLIFTCVILLSEDEYATDERRVEELRKMKDYVPSPVNTGFVFINGKYIDAPYQLKLTKVLKLEHKEGDCYQGGGVLSLNGYMLGNHVIRKALRYKGDKLPVVPVNITKSTSFYDRELHKYMAQVAAYVKHHQVHGEEGDIMAKALRKLPNFKKAIRKDKDTMYIETYKGETVNCGLTVFRSKGPNFPDFYKQIIWRVKQYHKRLENGGILFFSDRSGDLQIPGGAETIALVQAFNPALSLEQRLSIVHKLGFGYYFDNRIIINSKGSDQLDERLQKLNRFNLKIAQIINNHDSSFAFIADNDSKDVFTTNIWGKINNKLWLNTAEIQKTISNNKDKKSPEVVIKPGNEIIWESNNIKKLCSQNRPVQLLWRLSDIKRPFAFQERICLWKDSGTAQNEIFITNGVDNSLLLRLAKMLDNSSFNFALIASNATKQAQIIPDFFSGNSKVKIKFPNGQTYTYFNKSKKQDTLQLKPGESKYLKFDIKKLLAESNKFSLDSFNYGMSELIWEVIMPDKSKVVRKFYLLKTEKPLPEISKTKGYIIDINTPLK